jgi:hypothetical protein
MAVPKKYVQINGVMKLNPEVQALGAGGKSDGSFWHGNLDVGSTTDADTHSCAPIETSLEPRTQSETLGGDVRNERKRTTAATSSLPSDNSQQDRLSKKGASASQVGRAAMTGTVAGLAVGIPSRLCCLWYSSTDHIVPYLLTIINFMKRNWYVCAISPHTPHPKQKNQLFISASVTAAHITERKTTKGKSFLLLTYF